MKFWIAAFLLTISSLAIASNDGGGGISGNGGDVVFCAANPDQPHYQMLDYYEAKLLERFDVALGQDEDSPERRVQYVIDWMAQYSPIRASLYQKALNEFASKTEFVDGPLDDIPDSMHIALPTGCEIRQLAIQTQKQGVPSYKIDKQIWSELDALTKAGLILHEIVYGEALRLGHKDSRLTRAFHRFLVKPKEARENLESFNKAVLAFGGVQEVPLASGEVIQLSGSFYYAAEDRVLDVKVCGYQLNGQKLVSSCEKKGVFIANAKVLGLKKILSLRDLNAKKLYLASPADVGLPMKVDDFSLEEEFFVPHDDLEVKTEDSHLVCQGGQKVEHPTVSRSSYYSKAKEGLFDYQPEYVTVCTLKQGANNEYLARGVWRKIVAFGDNRHLHSRVSGTRLVFANYEAFRVGPWALQAKEIDLSDESDSYYELGAIKPVKIDFAGGSCEISHVFVSKPQEAEKFTMTTTKPCKVRFNGADFSANQVTVLTANRKIVGISLAAPAAILITNYYEDSKPEKKTIDADKWLWASKRSGVFVEGLAP